MEKIQEYISTKIEPSLRDHGGVWRLYFMIK